jgi:carbonic anhydrase
MQLLEKLRAIGVERHMLPDNLTEFFGMFGSDRQNVIKAADIARQSPLIGPKIPIHGLLVDIETGKLDWLVNGYQAAETMTTRWNEFVQSAGQTVDKLKSLSDFNIGEMKFPETKIGETVTNAENWLSQKVHTLEMRPAEIAQEAAEKAAAVPPRIPLPPPIRPRLHVRRGPK